MTRKTQSFFGKHCIDLYLFFTISLALQNSSIIIYKFSVFMMIKEKSKQEREKTVCSICFQQSTKDNKIVEFSAKCGHLFCQRCIRAQITQKIYQFKEISCPYLGCPQIVQENSAIFRDALTWVQKQKYYMILIRAKINKDPNQRQCPQESCLGYIMANESPFLCVLCLRVYCPECMQTEHKGSCSDYTALMLKEKMGFQRCFKCKNVVERIQGCNHITCKCGNQFCYHCEAEWTGYDHICNSKIRERHLQILQNAEKSRRQRNLDSNDSRANIQVNIQSNRRNRNYLEPIGSRRNLQENQRSEPRIFIGQRNNLRQEERGCCKKTFILIGYIFLLIVVDLMLCLFFGLLLLLSFLKDVFIGIGYRSCVQLKSKLNDTTSICGKILTVVFIFPILIFVGIILEVGQNIDPFIAKFNYLPFYFLRNLVLREF